MFGRPIVSALALLVSLAATTAAKADTTFTFAGLPFDERIPADYGTRFLGTPHVSVSWAALPGQGTPAAFDYNDPNRQSVYPDGGYGDLATTIWQNGPIEVVFTADPNFAVSIQSLDLAGWLQPTWGSQPPYFDNITVANGSASYTFSNVTAPGTGHTSVDFAGLDAATGSQVTLTLQGTNSGEIGYSNLRFSETAVPEPLSLAILALGGLGGLVLRRRHA